MTHLTSPAFSHGGSQRLYLFSVLLWPLPAAVKGGHRAAAITVENVNGNAFRARSFRLYRLQTFFILHFFHCAPDFFDNHLNRYIWTTNSRQWTSP